MVQKKKKRGVCYNLRLLLLLLELLLISRGKTKNVVIKKWIKVQKSGNKENADKVQNKAKRTKEENKKTRNPEETNTCSS